MGDHALQHPACQSSPGVFEREKRRGGRGRGSGCCVGVRDIEINKVSRVDKEGEGADLVWV